ncbi:MULTISPECIES: threonine--tRNA ligase [Glutamicibacter]|jgi:threonyl-tRNA synthetase|uniref:Threonine--tRNA ligase n=2 Tax=Glutamicibacter arilaitensis TaxID=256701 RepID=A0A2N7S410_9MICC|nr:MULTISPECIES: threonine--tRNA ligase [Glutamicibacter]PMQ20837.1 threonine--tRNA ligase [Glutamicibacter arilaitensis]TFH57091.1 threonine--tRNA ligase [Glutamicibacter arilaitensis]CBT75976.1 threonine--tRNA ligase [Glutamicibacter arilaitensis Re117]HCH48072.1 threonine--tRNA ligase [Glutamicibacter sp.]HCM94493.1 threonine--tRNA ligase [Glutamicibacter sp.]
MSEQLTLTIDGEQVQVDAGTTGLQHFANDKDVVVMHVDGVLRDLARELEAGTTVTRVTITDPEGLEVLRHSTAHVMAQAVQQLRPDSKLGIGPYITDGFYFDFDVEDPFTPEDLKQLEKMMQKIINQNQLFVRREVSPEEAKAEMANEPYKCELLAKADSADTSGEGVTVEVAAGETTIYDNVDRKSGETVWKDLCRGPHLPNTKLIKNAYALTRSAAAYWLGSEKNKQLQRIYGTAWPTKDDLKAYQERLAEAERRDHRKLGAELDLFSFPDELGSGLPVFHPKGGIIKREMEDYVRDRHVEEGFQYVGTPHISKDGLFHTSGHLPYYADTMFPALHIDEERDEDGNITKQGQEYRLKAMNCPMHNLIFRGRGRSYRELPLRLFEFGHVYRYEKSGVVHGLTRVRGFSQDDSHSYVTKEQAPAEVEHLLNFMLSLLRDFGMDDFYLELSTRDPESDKFIGSDEQWNEATAVLERVATESGVELVADPGGAAFYGPKISVQAKDAIGRTWQMGTVQYDFNQPARFGLEYQAADGTRQEPVMIHAAKFGSIERFLGVLTEHYAGAFPAWLSPVQVRAIPVAEAFNDYLGEVVAKLKAAGVRVELDDSSDRFPKKIRNASKDKIPFVLIAGGEDADANAVSFRFRDGSQENQVPVDDAVARIVEAIKSRDNNN